LSTTPAINSPKPIRADLRQIILALSDTLDLVAVDEVSESKRVAIIAAECGKQAGLDEREITFLFDLGLLRDIGVSSTQVHDQLYRELDWVDAQRHCDEGANLIQGVRALGDFVEPIRLHHTHWERLELMELPLKTKEHANRIFLAERVNALATPYYGDRSLLLKQASHIRDEIKNHTRSHFSPLLVMDFLAASSVESFWLNLEPLSVSTYLRQLMNKSAPIITPVRELKCLAGIFGRIVDGKSPYMTNHSLGVSRLARYLGERSGLDSVTCEKIEIAGLLHDLGKLRIPDEIIEKPGELNDFERHIMKSHSLETVQILKRIAGFDEISEWVAYEMKQTEITGQSYQTNSDKFSLEAKIMRVADVLQAMLQDRPFRKALSAEQVSSFLEMMRANGELDAELVAMIIQDLDAAIYAAKPVAGK